jgi:hypothetical protein
VTSSYSAVTTPGSASSAWAQVQGVEVLAEVLSVLDAIVGGFNTVFVQGGIANALIMGPSYESQRIDVCEA